MKQSIVERLRNICNKYDLSSINHLAEKSGISQAQLHKFISGEIQNPKINTIEMICEGLEIHLADLLQEEDLSLKALQEISKFREYAKYRYPMEQK